MAVLAASATIFGSPVIGAIILIEAAGLGGPMLPLVLLHGLMSAGIGSVVFIGMGHWTGLSSSAYAVSPFSLPAFPPSTAAEFGWAMCSRSPPPRSPSPLSRAHAGRRRSSPGSRGCCCRSPRWPSAAWRSRSPRSPTSQPMSSCSPARTPSVPLVKQGPTLALSTLAFLLLFMGLAWSISLGSFCGGPTFPALFIGAVGGLLAAHLPGFSETPAVAVPMAATVVSILRLPLSATVITLLLVSKAGLATSPLIIVAVVVAYLTIQTLSSARGPAPAPRRPLARSPPRRARIPPQPQTPATVRHDHWAPCPRPAPSALHLTQSRQLSVGGSASSA